MNKIINRLQMAKKRVIINDESNKAKRPEASDNKKDIGNKSKSATSLEKEKEHRKAENDKTPKSRKTQKKEKDTAKDDKIKESVEEKLADVQNKYLRLSAEFDNYRKRTLKEKIDLTKSAGESILVNLLPVMDDFDRAVKMMEDAEEISAIKEGVDLIYNKFIEFLKQNGVKEIESNNCEFDTDLHEAITKIPAPDKSMKGKVVDVIQKGYYLNDKVIRYSKVVIGE